MRRLAMTAAAGLIGLIGWSATPMASADAPTASPQTAPQLVDRGLAKRVVVTGLCDGVGRYRLVVANAASGRPFVNADLTVRGVTARSKWNVTTEATTYFGDGTAVTGVADFGSARADREGRFDVGMGTPAGVRHSFHFTVFRGPNRCLASVSA